MSREIKFRAWIKPLKRYADYLEYDLNEGWVASIEEHPNITADDYHSAYFYDKKGEIILEQYTGLKDKNGKEIYEGDVIKMPPELCYEQDETTGVVEFSHGSFYVKDKQFSDGAKHVVDFYDFNDPEAEFEVIGNIHENGGKDET